jgi:hypothetical protein
MWIIQLVVIDCKYLVNIAEWVWMRINQKKFACCILMEDLLSFLKKYSDVDIVFIEKFIKIRNGS